MSRLTAKNIVSNLRAYGVLRTTSMFLATSWSFEGKMITSVLLGEDGFYWVAPTNRIESILINAGYERV